jgi:hypothetical protein
LSDAHLSRSAREAVALADTARSAIVVASVSPERCDTTAEYPPR